jgi:predicted nucleic acid-binding protein
VIRSVILDSSPLGLATSPKPTVERDKVRRWLTVLRISGVHIIVPEIADYEVRRELIRAGKQNGLRLLDRFNEENDYLPLNTEAMRRAARLWAEARMAGHPTAPDSALDADVILAAQALALGLRDDEYIVATSNQQHLSRFVAAKRWQEIITGDE